jgi:hypothetical protein
MPRAVVLVLAVVGMAFAAPATARAAVDQTQFQAATETLLAADPTAMPPPEDPARDSVHGAGHNGGATLAVSAWSDPIGGDPTGTGVANSGGGFHTHVRFEVTCLAVAGNLASVGVVVVGGNLLPEGTESIISIRDSGLPGGTKDGYSVIAAEADTCAALLPIAAVVPPMESGNFHIRDALPSLP